MNRSFIIAAGGGRDNMPVADFGLEGRVAVVTGASRGIGEAIARGFAEHGATVVISSRKQESPEQVAAAIENAGGKAIPIACHGGKPEQMQALFDRVEEEQGQLDILVNNAATNPYFGPAIDAPDFLRRYGQPADLAGAAIYLASDASSYASGSVIVLDGGYSA